MKIEIDLISVAWYAGQAVLTAVMFLAAEKEKEWDIGFFPKYFFLIILLVVARHSPS